MKQKINRLICFIVTICLTVIIIRYLGRIVRPINTDIAFNAINTFHDMPENSIEVMGYGSSHIWRGLDPMEMYDKYGIGSYNYGCNWQHINTTQLFLEDSLRTQKPKLVVIETFQVNDLLEDINMNGEIFYTRAIPNSDAKKKYLKQCFGDDKERYLSYYLPLCAFHDNWVNIEKGNFSANSDETNFYASMGYVCTHEVKPVPVLDPATYVQKKLSPKAIKILDEMVALCKEQGIEVLFYTSPWKGPYAYGDAMEEYAKANGCRYLNMFEYVDEIGINCMTDFMDEGHLNDSGAKKASDFLGQYIVDNYDLTDMRTVEGNIWEMYR